MRQLLLCQLAYIYTKTKSTKDITYVIAKDKKTNEYFKCKVGFGEISKISIEKNFDTINVGDIFELHVLAHDDRGNIFSSLEDSVFILVLSFLIEILLFSF